MVGPHSIRNGITSAIKWGSLSKRNVIGFKGSENSTVTRSPPEDVKRVIEFAETLGMLLFVLPKRVTRGLDDTKPKEPKEKGVPDK